MENSCHWGLDMTFRDDESRLCERHLRENFAWLNRFALSLLKRTRPFAAGGRAGGDGRVAAQGGGRAVRTVKTDLPRLPRPLFRSEIGDREARKNY
jgi:hypothetical protein